MNVCSCVRTYMHAHIRTILQRTYRCANMHHTYVHSYIQTYIQTCIRMNIHVWTYLHLCEQTFTHMYTYVFTHTHTYALEVVPDIKDIERDSQV